MSRLWILSVVAVALSLAAPGASAFTITITGLEGTPTLKAGESHAHEFTVTMASRANQNFICSANTDLPVALSVAQGVDENFQAAVDPPSVSFTVPAGAYVAAAGQTWTGADQKPKVTATVVGVPPGHTEHTFQLRAEYAGGVPAGCQGDFPGATATGDYVVPLQADPAGEANGTTSPGTNETDGGGESNGSPGPGPALLAGVVLVAFLLRRRQA